MTEPPPMKPSAHDRLISQSMQQWTPGPPAAERAIEEAYRDGFQAIIAELREPSDELIDQAIRLMTGEMGHRPNAGDPTRVHLVLRALADHLEHQL